MSNNSEEPRVTFIEPKSIVSAIYEPARKIRVSNLKRWRRWYQPAYVKLLAEDYEHKALKQVGLENMLGNGINGSLDVPGKIKENGDEMSELRSEIERTIHETFMARTNLGLTIVIGVATICGVAAQILQVVRDCK